MEASADKNEFIRLLYRLAHEAKGFRASSFNKAARALELFDSEEITLSEAQEIPGVGVGILKRLKEFIETGHLAELKESEEEMKVLELFTKIYGIGPVTAHKLYERGYRTLDDIPHSELTRSQQLGLLYFEDINSRIPRAEIVEFEEQLNRKVRQFNRENGVEIKTQICGSYLRGKKESGDIDIIIAERNNRLSSLLDAFLNFLHPLVEFILARGKVKILTLGGIGVARRRIDLELVNWENWPYALLYFTGSKNFNKCIRQGAKNKGYTLNQEGLFEGNLRYQMDTERDIFDFLDLKYLTPAEREEF